MTIEQKVEKMYSEMIGHADRAKKHLKVIAEHMEEDEEPILVFGGLHKYISVSNHDFSRVYVITNKQKFLSAQKKLLWGYFFEQVRFRDIKQIKVFKELVYTTLEIRIRGIIRDTWSIGIASHSEAKIILNKINEMVDKKKSKNTTEKTIQLNIDIEKVNILIKKDTYLKNKIKIIKYVRELTGYSLKDAKKIVDNGGIILNNIPYNEATQIKETLEMMGATIELKNVKD